MPDLDGNTEDRFSCDTAYMSLVKRKSAIMVSYRAGQDSNRLLVSPEILDIENKKYEPRHEKTNILVTAKLISAFVFAT